LAAAGRRRGSRVAGAAPGGSRSMTSLDLALVGNGTIGALVSPLSEVVWACFPRFDGDPVFCSLLRERAGDTDFGFFAVDLIEVHFLVAPAAYWREWVRSLAIPFEWQDAVIRAAITLKLNVFEDTGAIIAAVTTSIPEAPGSGRNSDYRYCWLRDAYFVINALNRLSDTQTMER